MISRPTPPAATRPWTTKIVVAAVAAALLVGCGTTDDKASDAPATGSSGGSSSTGSTNGSSSASSVDTTDDGCTDDVTTESGPVTLTDAFGRTVELDQPAERVVALEWQQIEGLLTLCVAPVAVADPQGYGTWVSAVPLPDGVEDVGSRGEPNIDALVASDPDLVIVEASAADDPIIAQVERIGVPVLATKGSDTADPVQHMLDTFTLIAQAVGRSERAETVIEEFETTLADGAEAVAAADLPGTDFVYLDGWIQGGNVALRPFGQGSLVAEIGEALGLENAWTGAVDEAYGLGQTDIEGMTTVDPTWVFHTGYEGTDPAAEDIMSALRENPIWASIPAVEEGRIHPFPAGIWTFGGPRSSQQVIDAYVEILTA